MFRQCVERTMSRVERKMTASFFSKSDGKMWDGFCLDTGKHFPCGHPSSSSEISEEPVC